MMTVEQGRQRQLWQSQQIQRKRELQKRRIRRQRKMLILVWSIALCLLAGYCYLLQNRESVRQILSYAEGLGAEDGGNDSRITASQGGLDSQVFSGSLFNSEKQDYASFCGLEEVDKPKERTFQQVIGRLEELAVNSDMIAEILQDSSKYPDKMLEALANNPEMADFVSGYQGNEKKASGGLTSLEKDQEFPLFLQWDPRWGYVEYGDDSNIGLSGCGPTCLSMALYYLTGREELTPDKVAAYSMKNGYYISGTGTAWALMTDLPAEYDIGVSQPKAEEYTMKAALDQGCVIICSMGAGDFTSAGHFIVIYGYEQDGFLVNDPNCVARSRKRWSFSELAGQIKNVWVLIS